MQLKLADYGKKKEKFERFIECGSSEDEFLYAGNEAIILNIKSCCDDEPTYFKKDEKDPLNRFDGRFNNRSYGDGRFILIENNEDDIKITETPDHKIKGYSFSPLLYGWKFEKPFTTEKFRITKVGNHGAVLPISVALPIIDVKNIHQNPELWEKVR